MEPDMASWSVLVSVLVSVLRGRVISCDAGIGVWTWLLKSAVIKYEI